MTQVATVRGPVDSAALGRTYMHEHIFVLTPDVQQNYPDEWGDEDTRVADAVQKLSELPGRGVTTIVDPTVIGLGRYIPRIQRIADQVPDLNIVVATGCYTYSEVPFFFHYRGPGLGQPVDPMLEMFVGDITEGIAGTGVRAGMLKCAIDMQGMTGGVERIMRAVAKAHRITGTPITIHTHPGTQQGLAARKVLDDEGVDPRRVVLGHSGDSSDVDHLQLLAEAGFILGMDRFGVNVETTFESRADTVVELCKRGFAESMVLAHDAACFIDWIEPWAKGAMPQWHYLHILDDVLPYLLGKGVTEDQIETMLTGTPRRIFETVDPY